MAFLIFYTTHPDERTARSVAAHLLEKRLVACANFLPVGSVYWWQGDIQQDDEFVAVFKTSLRQEEAVAAEIAAIHPYETPCIIRFEVRANEAYEAWIEAETSK